MPDEIKLWAQDSDGVVSPVDRIPQVDYEREFEDTLIARPDMLMPGLTLVGRQLQTASGPLDLLGVDADGRLVVYELKRGDTPRDAISQAIDYASWLDSLDFDELSQRISEHVPAGLSRAFEVFADWYAESFAEEQFSEMRPSRIVLVGLGIEPSAERMARWLNSSGLDIEALTFHAFRHAGETLFGRQIEVERHPAPPPAQSGYIRQAERRKRLASEAERLGISDLFNTVLADIRSELPTGGYPSANVGGYSLQLPRRTDWGTGSWVTVGAIRLDASQPPYLALGFNDVCEDLVNGSLAQLREHHKFIQPSSGTTNFPINSLDDWTTRRSQFLDAFRSVVDANNAILAKQKVGSDE